jgi:methylenetetrahydrofolate dehydrogenase (NAD+)
MWSILPRGIGTHLYVRSSWRLATPLGHCFSSVSHRDDSSPPPSTTTAQALTTANVLDVSPLAEAMRTEIRQYARQHNDLKLVGILAGQDREDAELYSERIAEAFWEDGMEYELIRCPARERSQVEQLIQSTNDRRDVHGILIFYPIFAQQRNARPKTYLNRMNGTYYKTDDDFLRDRVDPAKDVEGLGCDWNARHLFRARAKGRVDDEIYVPCTALAVKKVLEAYHIRHDWSQVVVTIINRSEILGRPLAALLALNGAKVFSVDEDSILGFHPCGRLRRYTHMDLSTCLKQSSIVVTGVPDANFCLPADAIVDGTTVVNVSEFDNVNECNFVDRPSVTLIPQIGKVTVAALQHNLIRLHQKSLGIPVTAI